MTADNTIKTTLFLVHGTSKALGFRRQQRRHWSEKASGLIWLPKSQTRILDRKQAVVGQWQEVVVEIPKFIAEQKDLVR